PRIISRIFASLLSARGAVALACVGLGAFLLALASFFGAAAFALPPLAFFWPLGALFFWVAPFFAGAFSDATCAPGSATAAVNATGLASPVGEEWRGVFWVVGWWIWTCSLDVQTFQTARRRVQEPALLVHTQLQLLSARVPVQTLTEQGSSRECRQATSNKTKDFRNSGGAVGESPPCTFSECAVRHPGRIRWLRARLVQALDAM